MGHPASAQSHRRAHLYGTFGHRTMSLAILAYQAGLTIGGGDAAHRLR